MLIPPVPPILKAADLLMASIATGAVYAATLVTTALADGYSPVFALQGGGDPTSVTDMNFVRWAIEQGGLVVAILVILYFYRQDFRRKDAQQAETIATLIKLVQSNTTAMEHLSQSIDDQQNDRFPPPGARIRMGP